MRFHDVAILVPLLLACGVPARAQTLTLEFHSGRVTLIAHDVPVSEILSEWTRLGGTRIVNGEHVSDSPVTLELTDVPEQQALDIVLRNVSGYAAALRTAANDGRSAFDSVLILPTGSAISQQRPETRPRSNAPAPENTLRSILGFSAASSDRQELAQQELQPEPDTSEADIQEDERAAVLADLLRGASGSTQEDVVTPAPQDPR